MNIQQLSYFLHICETKSLTKSASLLYVTQPALSKSIASLEKEMGAGLFIKNNNGVRLTPCGELFQLFAHNTLNELEEIKREMAHITAAGEQCVSAGFTHAMDSLFMSKLCSDYYECYPEQKKEAAVVLQQFGSAQELTGALLAGKIDYAFLIEQELLKKLQSSGRLEYETIHKNRLAIYAGSGHRLSEYREIDARLVKDETIIVNNEIFYDLAAGLQAYNSFMLMKSDNTMIMDMVAHGMGLFLAGDNIHYDPSQIRQIVIPGEQSRFVTVMAWEKKKACCRTSSRFKKYVLDNYCRTDGV